MSTPDVVVVGGGIGGLSTAYALACTGQRVRVLEQAERFGEVGAGLQLAPNATRVLRRWGLLDQVTAAGVLPRRLVFKDALDGVELTSLYLDTGFVDRYQAPYVLVHRSDLHAILVQACHEAGVELLAASRADDVVLDSGGATVLTEDGEHRADVVVAADGLWSTLRRTVSDDEPVCSGYVAYRGARPLAEVREHVDPDSLHDVVVYIGPDCHLVQYSLRHGEIHNTVAVFASPAYRRGESDWGTPAELDAAFAPACEQVQRGLQALWRDRRWPMYDRLPIDTWTHGRFVLTGDAAHPMLQYFAQGACQAMEDAHSLATHVAKGLAGGTLDWPAVLAAYQHERVPRTARVQTNVRTWGDIWHCDGLTRTLRNALLLDRRLDDYRHIDWLYQA